MEIESFHRKFQIFEVEKGKKSRDAICKEYSVVKSSLATFLKDKDKIWKTIDQGMSKQKQMQTSTLDNVDEALFCYFLLTMVSTITRIQRSFQNIRTRTLNQSFTVYAKIRFKILDLNLEMILTPIDVTLSIIDLDLSHSKTYRLDQG